MKRLLHDLGLILLLAGLWAISGYIIGIALETSGIAYPPLKIIFASLNAMMGKAKCQVGPSIKYRSGGIRMKKADDNHKTLNKKANNQQTNAGNDKTNNLSRRVFGAEE